MNNLYKQLRNMPIYRSKKYLKWLKENCPDLEPHHLIGSQTSIKLNDYLVNMVSREEHQRAEKEKEEHFSGNLAQSLNRLFKYVQYLETK
jgi:hypothetical protein